MNQILVTEKFYVTPELKRKRRIYKFDFIVSICLICILAGYSIYIQIERNNKEKISQDILSEIDENSENIENNNINDDPTVKMEDNVLVVVLNNTKDKEIKSEVNVNDLIEKTENLNELKKMQNSVTTKIDGVDYDVLGVLNIPNLNIKYPILSETNEKTLEVSLTKFWGPKINEVGNFVIAGHNYRNKKFFGKLLDIKNGEIIEITDLTGRKVQYKVYSLETVEPKDLACTSQLTGGKKEITLITCTATGKERFIVKAREI